MAFFIKVENGIAKAKKDTTDHDPDGVTPNKQFATLGDPDGDYHTHQDHPSPAYRHPHDPQDICVSNGIVKKKYYRSYVDCGDKIYAVVVENTDLVKNFFRKPVLSLQFKTPWLNLLSLGMNRRKNGLQYLKMLLGNSLENGLGLYESSNVDKTEFIKLN